MFCRSYARVFLSLLLFVLFSVFVYSFLIETWTLMVFRNLRASLVGGQVSQTVHIVHDEVMRDVKWAHYSQAALEFATVAKDNAFEVFVLEPCLLYQLLTTHEKKLLKER